MFIKFSDKTKNIMVKNSKELDEKNDSNNEDSIFLDSDDENDRRIKALKQHVKNESKDKS